MTAGPAWEVHETPAALAQRAVELISAAAQRAIAARGVFRIVLAGGSAPQASYALLADSAQQWLAWRVFLGDERCLSADDPQRNLQMLQEKLLSRVAIPAAHIYCPAVETGCSAAAVSYAQLIAPHLPFDLVMLGVGEDGHTASLFPGRAHDPDALCEAVTDAPKPPPERVSMGLGALRHTRAVLVLTSDSGKRDALARWRAGDTRLPITRACAGLPGHVLIDRAAAD